MRYLAAIESISCIISACNPEIQDQILEHVYYNSNEYRDNNDRLQGFPTQAEIEYAILHNTRMPFRRPISPESFLTLDGCRCEYCKPPNRRK